MNLENRIKHIFDNICKEENNYSGIELEKIIDKVLELDEIKTNEDALSQIEKVAKERVSGLTQEQVERAKTADQKWLNMSGLAYENIIMKETNALLKDTDVLLFSPTELKEKILKNQITNSEQDILDIKNWIQGGTFDLYIIKVQEDKFKVFGVVQCKKSIRERVSRDREPSIIAMKKGFISILIGMNGDALGKTENTKARQMINGNSNHFKEQGWYAAYFEKLPFENGVIYKKEKLIKDLLNAKNLFKN